MEKNELRWLSMQFILFLWVRSRENPPNSYLKDYEICLQESERFQQFDKASRVFHRYGVLLLDKFG